MVNIQLKKRYQQSEKLNHRLGAIHVTNKGFVFCVYTHTHSYIHITPKMLKKKILKWA